MLPKIYSPGHVIQNWATVCSYMYIHCMLLFTFPEASTVRTKWSHLPLWRLSGWGGSGQWENEGIGKGCSPQDREMRGRRGVTGERERGEKWDEEWVNRGRILKHGREGLVGWVGGGREGGSRRVGQSTCASVGGGIYHNTSPSLVLPLVQEMIISFTSIWHWELYGIFSTTLS